MLERSGAKLFPFPFTAWHPAQPREVKRDWPALIRAVLVRARHAVPLHGSVVFIDIR